MLYWGGGPFALALTFWLGFAAIERLLVLNGRAKAVILVTTYRVLRVADWPWRRVWTRDYLGETPKVGLFRGMIMLGRIGFAVHHEKVEEVIAMMRKQSEGVR